MKAALVILCLFSLTFCFQSSAADVVKCVLEDENIFKDIAKLVEVIQSGEFGKIFSTVLEIYPDFVAVIKNCFQKKVAALQATGESNGLCETIFHTSDYGLCATLCKAMFGNNPLCNLL